MNLIKLKQELLSGIDQDNQVELEKVERYLALTKTFKKLQKEASKHPIVVVENGSQRFVKTNPAINDMNRINASLIALGRDMGLSAPPPNGGSQKGSSGGYNTSDLL